MTYFSDREFAEQSRTEEDIDEIAWEGFQALINGRIDDGSFGASFPKACPDGSGPVGTDRAHFEAAMRAEIRAMPEYPWRDSWDGPPATLVILDLLEFCWRHITEPIQGSYHGFLDHYHLSFDYMIGRQAFTEDVNRIFARSGLAYHLIEPRLDNQGQIVRLGPPLLRDELTATYFATGDFELDHILDSARNKFLNPSQEIRREALLELWDAWERLKTTGEGANKKSQISDLLNGAAGPGYPKFRQLLEKEALELTSIGNNYQMRHTEIRQEKVEQTEHIDYLFHRLFSLIQLVLKTKGT